MNNLIIGSHVSFNKDEQLMASLKEALSYSSTTFMFYTGAPQNTKRFSIDKNKTDAAKKIMKDNNIDINNVIVHAPYIINLANPNNLDFSTSFLKQELNRVDELGVRFMVLHPGSHVGYGIKEGINNIIRGLNNVLEEYTGNVIILLETMAGKGSEIGSNLLELKEIIDGIKYDNHIGICLDTCHLNDSGYDMEKFDDFLKEFDEIIGIDRIKCLHINDSKNELGARKDRHENIGFGTIGFNNLINIIYNEKLINIPKILETPKIDGLPPYKFEIEMIKNKNFNKNLINDMKDFYN